MYYGNLVSEGVFDLDGFTMHNAGECPSCHGSVNYRLYDSCSSGCLNNCRSIDCPSCGYHSCDDDDCSICHARSVKEESEKLAISYGITNATLAYLFLADIETELMVLLAKAKVEFPQSAVINVVSDSYVEPIFNTAERLHYFRMTEYSELPLSKEMISVSIELVSDIFSHLGMPDIF